MSEIEINQGIQYGRPCIKGTGIPAEIVAERHRAGETVKELARDYGVTVQQIRFAILYEEKK